MDLTICCSELPLVRDLLAMLQVAAVDNRIIILGRCQQWVI